jgi:hypothetical protein
MKIQYLCNKEERKAAVLTTRGADERPVLNGIDYLEISSADQKELQVHFIHNLPGQENPVPSGPALTADNIIIEGGKRVKNVRVESVSSSGSTLIISVNTPGDFSIYTLHLVASHTVSKPPEGFDPELSGIEFSFKVDCRDEFDCKSSTLCPLERLPEPVIDYLAKDYSSFRQLMLDRLSAIMPDWKERNPADLGIVLVETLAYAADHLSYYQDAVATEAYLGTARKRISVRRHSRLLDYPMHDGCNARVWVAIQAGREADGLMLPGPSEKENRGGTQLLTQVDASTCALNPDDFSVEVNAGVQVFETMHDITLYEACNEIRFYTWGNEHCCLPKGATRATLMNKRGTLQNLLVSGDVLIFEEVRSPFNGRPEDADPLHRHPVRLTDVEFAEDPLFLEDPENPESTQRMRVVKIQWLPEDALPFPLCLWEVEGDEPFGSKQPVSIARGNVVLADHGMSIVEELDEVPLTGRYRPSLKSGTVTQQGRMPGINKQMVLFDPKASARAAFLWEIQEGLPSIRLHENGENWIVRRDLLNSDRFAREFVLEMEDDGSTYLRFGDGVLGKRPAGGSHLKAIYRVGNGRAGNVGAEAIAHVVISEKGIINIRNPLPAQGGSDPELIQQVRLYASQAFRIQERAVTESDYAAAARRHPEVQNALAIRRWTGSWYTIFITIDRKGGKPLDREFIDELSSFLERFRLAGYDLEIDGPRYIPIDIALNIFAAPDYLHSNIKEGLLETFSNRDLPDGRRGFFHPDNFTFGTPVYLSQVIAAAMEVPGVAWVKPTRFQRWGQETHGELDDSRITFDRFEIARLDNDPNEPENGKIEFDVRGGI